MAFKYKPRSREQLETRKNASASDFVGIFKDGVKVYTVNESKQNAIRILPPTWEDAEHYGIDVHIHYSVGPDRAAVLCLQKHKNKPCPVCELRTVLQARGDEDEAKEIRASKSVVMYIVDRDNEREGVQAWRAPFSLDADIVKLCVDDRSGETFNIDDPVDGYDVFFDTEGKAIQRKYKGIKLARKPTSLATKFIKYAEENPLNKQLNFLSYEEVERLLGGGLGKPKKRGRDDDDDDDRRTTRRDDDDEDEKPKKRSSRRDDDDDEDDAPRKKRSSRRDDDDEEDEKPRRRSSRDDDDDEDEKPKSRRRPSDDDDDEDDAPRKKRARDDDDEDEDEKPKKKRSRDEDDDIPFDGGKRVKRSARDDEDDDEDEKPKKKRARDDDDDEDDEPAPKKSAVREKLAERKRR